MLRPAGSRDLPDELLRMLLAVSIALGLLATIASVAALFVWQKQKQALQPDLEFPSLAPSTWLFSPKKAARLHRRIHGVIRMVQSCAAANSHRVPPNRQVAKLTRDIIQEAVVLDDQLVATGHMGRGVGRRLITLIEPQVTHLEELAGRLAVMTGGSSRPGTASAAALMAIDERLSSIEAAHHEIIHLETLLSSSSDEATKAVAGGSIAPWPDLPTINEGRDPTGDQRKDPGD